MSFGRPIPSDLVGRGGSRLGVDRRSSSARIVHEHPGFDGAYVRPKESTAQPCHRHKRLKVAAQATATVTQSQVPQSLQNNLVTLEADNPGVYGGKTAVYLLGVSHVSEVIDAQGI